MLPISNVAIPNVQFQSTYAKASTFANASTSAKATVDKSVDETADKLELATLATGNISTSTTFSARLEESDNRHLAAHEVAMERGIYGIISAVK